MIKNDSDNENVIAEPVRAPNLLAVLPLSFTVDVESEDKMRVEETSLHLSENVWKKELTTQTNIA